MAMQIKHGNTIPTINDLKDYQLGFNTSNNHLYTKEQNNIIDLNAQVANFHKIRVNFDPNKIFTTSDVTPFRNLNNWNPKADNTVLSHIDSYSDLTIDNAFVLRHAVIKLSPSSFYRLLYIKNISNSPMYALEITHFDTHIATGDSVSLEGRRNILLQNNSWYILDANINLWWNEIQFFTIMYGKKSILIKTYCPQYVFKSPSSTIPTIIMTSPTQLPPNGEPIQIDTELAIFNDNNILEIDAGHSLIISQE